MGEIPGQTMGLLTGSGEHLVGGAKPPNGLPVLMKASWAPMTLTAASSSLSSSSIAIGILGILLLYMTGGLLPDGAELGAVGTRRSNKALGPEISLGT